MTRRTAAAIAATTALGLPLFAAPGAGAAVKPKKNEILILGKTVFKPGKFARDNQRFVSRKAKVASGATITVKNRARTEDPHTLTFVEKGSLPTSFEAPAADVAFAAHAPQGDTGPFFPIVENGVGVDDPTATLTADTLGNDTTAGDSMFIPPKDSKSDVVTTSFTVGAAPGSKLYYFCAIHPWMQGKITVK
jgi:hypothetical protein